MLLEKINMADSTAPKKMHPPSIWAQRADTVFVTVSLENIKDHTLKVDDDRLFFQCKVAGDDHQYELDFKFFKGVDSSSTKKIFSDREFFIAVKKKEPGTPFWPRLLESKDKQHWLKVDFNRWKDEDDSDVEEDGSFEDMMRKMGGGVPQQEMLEDLNDGEEEDSDDEEMPDLE